MPSVGTFSRILKRNGLVTPRRRRYRAPPASAPLSHATAPNALWCIDFKGDFMVGKTRCYPLTIMDAFSRFLIACVALRRPELSVWWRKLGIEHERIEPGKPQQNGRHERMHLTLKLDTAMPPCSSFAAQQRAFDHFRHEYNEVRPHEALANRVPADYYARSQRVLPNRPQGPDFDYQNVLDTVRVSDKGTIYWSGRSIAISVALRYQLLGLVFEPNLDILLVFLGPLLLGELRRTRAGHRFVRYVPSDDDACHGACTRRSIASASTDQPPRQAPSAQMPPDPQLSPMS